MEKTEDKKEGLPKPPEYLSEKAKDLFVYYVRHRIKTPGQIALFIRGLEAMDQADECGKLIRQDGLYQVSERSKMTRQNPLLNTQKEATAQMLKVWKALYLNINREQRLINTWPFKDLSSQ